MVYLFGCFFQSAGLRDTSSGYDDNVYYVNSGEMCHCHPRFQLTKLLGWLKRNVVLFYHVPDNVIFFSCQKLTLVMFNKLSSMYWTCWNMRHFQSWIIWSTEHASQTNLSILHYYFLFRDTSYYAQLSIRILLNYQLELLIQLPAATDEFME